ncbi:PREDICTED: transcription factor PIF4-like isoform X2 [Nelumbo nucifera]|uniref:Transcription factor PIF4-like isoform X2 n=1 Tax=Nelumbo nucifera TaxID=4432 RepID=A0A1U8Q018_NELNU|nr:PREDICTED: transcription factor PIF4-like isoform X2 [Nelumbo nucifera]
MGPDNGLAEILWQNGQVVLHSQTRKKPGLAPNESRQLQKSDQSTFKGCGSFGKSSNLIQDDETASWIQFPFEDSLEKEFCSDFFCELPNSNSSDADEETNQFEGDKPVKFGASEESNIIIGTTAVRSEQPAVKKSNNLNFAETPICPPRLQIPALTQKQCNFEGGGKIINFSLFSRASNADLGSSNEPIEQKGSGNVISEVRESSVMTVGSSHCGSNQVLNEVDFSRVSSNWVGANDVFLGNAKECVHNMFPQCKRTQTGTLDGTVTSSSGGSGGSIGKAGKESMSTSSHKRKGRDADESECQSEEAEFESDKATKPAQRSGSACRSRAAEVHNLSERSDKASMLDEVIEYLKSLQLQLQIMWMGSGMAPMMFPGIQNYISRMGMGMAPPPLPSIHSAMQLPRVPLVDQAIPSASTPNQSTMCPTPLLNPINFQNQMQNSNFPEQYAHYMSFQQMQTAQPMNMFPYGFQTVQKNHKMAFDGCPPTDSTQSGKLG